MYIQCCLGVGVAKVLGGRMKDLCLRMRRNVLSSHVSSSLVLSLLFVSLYWACVLTADIAALAWL
jgi:hypothetical protein